MSLSPAEAGRALVNQLRQASFPDDYVREMRALFVAQALAYQVPLKPGQTAEELYSEHEALFLGVLNRVNETLPVDTRLTRSVFKKVIAGRMALLMGVGDPTLVRACLHSDAQEGYLDAELHRTMESFLSLPEYSRNQRSGLTVLAGMFDDEGGSDE